MTIYAQSDLMSVKVGPGHGGCGQVHERERDAGGYPVQPWALTCDAGCEDFLRASDDRWSTTLHGITETYDEKASRDHYEKAGVQARDSLLAIAMARMAGIGSDQIPPALQKMLTGLPAHVPGVTVCPKGHDNTPGNRFCGQCGSPMRAPAAKGELASAAA